MSEVSDINPNDPLWERKIIEKLALDALTEQRRRRRWGIFFRFLGFGYLIILLVVAFDFGGGDRLSDGKKHTALVQLTGVIRDKGDASAEHVVNGL